ncbi:Fic/DOC family protein [Terriglobus sp. ADX1]|uniref:Fic/DOC family protein n=1 Tax=Terriglobus sp. ADX1 TaxID=2794063 RepID=UPI003AD07B11
MYDAFDDPYAYSGSTVLQNLLDIRDPVQLEAFEIEISTLRAEEPLPEGNFDAQHYCRIHHHLFQDVYAWAGKYRTVRTSKGGNSFCYPEYIEQEMNSLCDHFQNGQKFANCERATFATLVAKFLGELNAIHPFREGNGRSQLAFIGLIGQTFGHPFHFERLEKDSFLAAMIASFAGQIDPLTHELARLSE